MEPTPFDLVAAKLEAAKEQHRAQLDRELYFDVWYDAVRYGHMEPRTHRERVRRWRQRITAYFSTLWKALRGVELEEPRDDYDY